MVYICYRTNLWALAALLILSLLWVSSFGNVNPESTRDKTSDRTLTATEAGILSKHSPLLLNVGGISPAAGWINVNIQYDNVLHDMENTDYILRNMSDLYGIKDRSVAILYSSHTLEHVTASNGDVSRILHEWRRVIRPGGLVMVAVPDLHMLARLFIEESYPPYVHDGLVAIIFGGQRDQFDFHMSGFDEVSLRRHMTAAGFCDLERVENFNMFPIGFDASDSYIVDMPISLNIIGRPCRGDSNSSGIAAGDEFFLLHYGSPYVKERFKLPIYDAENDQFVHPQPPPLF